MVVDPGFDFAAESAALALTLRTVSVEKSKSVKKWRKTYVVTVTATTTLGAIKEVLLQSIAHAVAKFWTRTADGTALAITSVGIIALGVATHDSFALLISACALTRRTLQPVTAALAIWGSLVCRTVARVTRADLLRVTAATACSADRALRRILALRAAVLVRIIADSSIFELATSGVTT